MPIVLWCTLTIKFIGSWLPSLIKSSSFQRAFECQSSVVITSKFSWNQFLKLFIVEINDFRKETERIQKSFRFWNIVAGNVLDVTITDYLYQTTGISWLIRSNKWNNHQVLLCLRVKCWFISPRLFLHVRFVLLLLS